MRKEVFTHFLEHCRRWSGAILAEPFEARRKTAIFASLVLEYAQTCPSSSLLKLTVFRPRADKR